MHCALTAALHAGASGRAARLDRLRERAGVVLPPGVGDGGVLRIGLRVAFVQARPRLLERRALVVVGRVRVRELVHFFATFVPSKAPSRELARSASAR